MPRKRTEINSKHLSILKNRVLDVSKIKLLRSVDCDKLAKEVLKKTRTYINGISFKRLYGFTKYPFNPAIQTLDILSQYVGYSDWYSFEQSLQSLQPISNQELDILLSFYDFDLINHIEFHSGGIQSMSRKIALRFREDTTTFKRVIPHLAKKEYAQIFFIEHFPDYDNLCSYYYLLYEAYLKEKLTDKAQLFGNCMLFLKSFWKLNEKECTFYLTKINKIVVTSEFHPFLVGRFYATKLLFETFYGDKMKIDSIYKEYLKLLKKLPKKGSHFLDFPASEYIVSEALLQCGEYEKCIELIESAFKEFSFRMEFVRKGYYRQMQLFWLIAKKKLNPKFEMESLLLKIDIATFYFISEKYFTVIYFYAMYLNSKSMTEIKNARKIAKSIENDFLKLLLNKC